ncbi:MAG: hypothetical protein ACRCSP_04645 [Rhodoglobus sp.]
MELTGVGGGLMLCLAAILWLAYLVPSWFKRHEYFATERNALRLQQTIRVLAESAEIPDAVRAEIAARQLAQAQPVALRGPVAVGPVRRPTISRAQVIAARRRRARAVTAVVLLAAVATAGVQCAVMIGAGATVVSWAAVLGCAGLVAGSLAFLTALAPQRQNSAVRAAPVARRTTISSSPVKAEAARQKAWVPVPVPKPLYLSRTVAQSSPAVDPSAELRRAAVSAEKALRASHRETAAARIDSARLRPSRFAQMGIVDDLSTATPDLDAMLARRRRAAG